MSAREPDSLSRANGAQDHFFKRLGVNDEEQEEVEEDIWSEKSTRDPKP